VARPRLALAFTTSVGTALDAVNVRRSFKAITKDAKVGEGWTPRETRHTFVSIMSDNDVPLEKIADLVGRKGTSVPDRVYWHQLKPAIRTGADTINAIFKTTREDAETA
jgi:hypothetical protein